MVGSAGWRLCNVVALVTPAASSTGPQDEEQTKGGGVPLSDCFATADNHTSVECSTSRPPARPDETVVKVCLDMGSTSAVRSEYATHSNTNSSNARSAQRGTGRISPNSSSGAASSERDAFHLRSPKTLLVPECVMEKNGEKRMSNVRFELDRASSSNSWLDSCTTNDNPVPYSLSNSNTNASALQNNSEMCAHLNQSPPPWFSHYGEDVYDHITKGLIYIETSIPGPGLDMDTFQQMPHGCNCLEDCSRSNGQEAGLFSTADANVNRSDDACNIGKLALVKSKIDVNQNCSAEGREKPTVPISGRESVAQNRCSQDGVTVSCGCSCSDRTPASYRNGLLVQPHLQWPIYECNDDCHCPTSTSPRSTSNGCQNRVVQRGPRRHLVIREAKGKSTRYLVNGGGESSLICDSQPSQDNDLRDVSMDRLRNFDVVLSDDPKSIKRQSHPLVSCQGGVNASLSSIEKIQRSVPREESLTDSFSKRCSKSHYKGLGVFTKVFIPRGSFICEYAGELLGEEEARCRFARQEREGKSNYILVLREFYGKDDVPDTDTSLGKEREASKHSSSNLLKYSQIDAIGQYCNVTSPNWRNSKNTSTKKKSAEQNRNFLKEGAKQDVSSSSRRKPAQVTIIDPTSIGNIGRYLNHSCDPNTHVVPVRVNSVIPVAAMFAVRDVLPGEELVYDYGSIREGDALFWTNGQPTNSADDVDVLGSMSDDLSDSCNFGIDRSKVGGRKIRKSLEKCVNAASPARHNGLDARKMTVGLQKRVLTHDPRWSQHRSTGKKQRLYSVPSSGLVKVKAMGLEANNIERVSPMAMVDFDVTEKRPCLCGAQNCRGYLPAEVDLF